MKPASDPFSLAYRAKGKQDLSEKKERKEKEKRKKKERNVKKSNKKSQTWRR